MLKKYHTGLEKNMNFTVLFAIIIQFVYSVLLRFVV
jgi:hypothetical protein